MKSTTGLFIQRRERSKVSVTRSEEGTGCVLVHSGSEELGSLCEGLDVEQCVVSGLWYHCLLLFTLLFYFFY